MLLNLSTLFLIYLSKSSSSGSEWLRCKTDDVFLLALVLEALAWSAPVVVLCILNLFDLKTLVTLLSPKESLPVLYRWLLILWTFSFLKLGPCCAALLLKAPVSTLSLLLRWLVLYSSCTVFDIVLKFDLDIFYNGFNSIIISLYSILWIKIYILFI